MADRSRTHQRQQMAPGTLAVFKAAGHQFGAPASLWGWFSRFGARGRAPLEDHCREVWATESIQNVTVARKCEWRVALGPTNRSFSRCRCQVWSWLD